MTGPSTAATSMTCATREMHHAPQLVLALPSHAPRPHSNERADASLLIPRARRDNAWIETTAVHYHCSRELGAKIQLRAYEAPKQGLATAGGLTSWLWRSRSSVGARVTPDSASPSVERSSSFLRSRSSFRRAPRSVCLWSDLATHASPLRRCRNEPPGGSCRSRSMR